MKKEAGFDEKNAFPATKHAHGCDTNWSTVAWIPGNISKCYIVCQETKATGVYYRTIGTKHTEQTEAFGMTVTTPRLQHR